MWTKFTNSKIFYAIVSIFCAIVCWLYVDIVQAPNTSQTINNIPVTFYGEDVLAEQGLMITEGKDATVSLTLTGPRSALYKLNRNNITISVQAASQISEEGTYSLYYTESYPSTISTSSIRVTNRSIDKITVEVVQMTSKTLDIQGEFTGTTVEGALYDNADFQFELPSVTVSGERSLVDQVARAVVTLDEQDLSATWSGDLAVVLEDAEGNPVDSSGLTCDVSSVYTIFPIKIVKELPLSVNFTEGGGATAEDVTYSISPKTVMVTGTQEDLDSVESLNLGSIPLSDVVTSDVFTFDIPTPDGISLLNGITSAEVTVNMSSSLTVRAVETSNIQLVNVPEGLIPSLETQSVVVRIRGAADVMSIVMDEDVIVSVDLANYTADDVGSRTVNATVSVKGFASVGTIGTCQVVVDLQKAD